MKRRDAPSEFTFSEGQKVLCINNSSESSLFLNETYTCKLCNGNKWIELVERPGKLYYANRFIPATNLVRELV